MTILEGESNSEGTPGNPGDNVDRPRKNKQRSKMGQVRSIN